MQQPTLTEETQTEAPQAHTLQTSRSSPALHPAQPQRNTSRGGKRRRRGRSGGEVEEEVQLEANISEVQLEDGISVDLDDVATLNCEWCKKRVVFDIHKLTILSMSLSFFIPLSVVSLLSLCSLFNEFLQIRIVKKFSSHQYTMKLILSLVPRVTEVIMSFVMTGKLGNHPLPPTPFLSFLTLFHYLLFSSDFCDRKQVACTALTNMERIHGRQFFPFAEVVRFVDSHFVQICNGLKYCTNIFFVLYIVLSCLLVLLMSVLMNITAKKWWKMLRSAVYRCTSSESHIHASGSGTSEYSFCFFISPLATFLHLFYFLLF